MTQLSKAKAYIEQECLRQKYYKENAMTISFYFWSKSIWKTTYQTDRWRKILYYYFFDNFLWLGEQGIF